MMLQVCMAVNFKITDFWDVSPYSLVNVSGNNVGKGGPQISVAA
jgi:hypothetical protein